MFRRNNSKRIFITSDHHFSHKNIIRYCKRPFNSVEEMNEIMINKWNKKVRHRDIVIHLGDFALAETKKIGNIRRKLNGTIILIQGNHDGRIKENCGFMIIRGSLQIGKFILSHRPLQKEKIPEGFINIHGHIHDKNSLNGINISVEKTNYEPIELRKIRRDNIK